MKTSTIPTCLALTLQLFLGYGCGVSIDPGGDVRDSGGGDLRDSGGGDLRDSGEIDSAGGNDASPAVDSGIADAGTRDADDPGGADARVADAAPGLDASMDAGVESTAVQVEAGQSHTCALAADGTVRCWGLNNAGQLGETTLTPYRTTPNEVAGLADVSQIALGVEHSCALMSDTTVRCWGANGTGQCGTGSTGGFLISPTAVEGLSGVLEIAAGSFHTCARLMDGSVRCWGHNYHAQLGDGSTTDRPRPTRVLNVAGVTDLGLGGNHTCAVNASGNVQCWGANGAGQASANEFDSVLFFPAYVPLLGASRAASVSLGFGHTCARMVDGTAQCWGGNASGQLGHGGQEGGHQHTTVTGLTTVVAIASGDYHSCVTLADGVVSCWGGNGNGQLGDGSNQERTVPTPAYNMTDGTGITANFNHSCALQVGGGLKCWGFNSSGQLGDGTTTQRLVPTPVLW